MKLKKHLVPLVKACRLAISLISDERRKKYAAGEYAYQQGIRTSSINSDGITGDVLSFAENSHNKYEEYTEAIRQLEDFIEGLTE